MSVQSRFEHDGAVLRLVIANGKGNVIDAAVTEALAAALVESVGAPGLRCVVIEGEGKHFSFGASVPEHTPEEVGAMLPRFHALVRQIVFYDVPVLALVRGQCLGGGLEVAAACSVLLAEAGAWFGQPEIKLGVLAPAGSVLLPARLAPAVAEELLLTGRSVPAAEAKAIGLVGAVFDKGAGEEGLQAWLAEHILPRSAAALRFALTAARAPLRAAVDARLQAVEDLYLNELMATADAVEGIAAFLERRPAVWTHR